MFCSTGGTSLRNFYITTLLQVPPTYLVLSTSFVNDPWRGLWWPPYPGISDHVPFFYFLSSPWLPTYLSVFLSTVKGSQNYFNFAFFNYYTYLYILFIGSNNQIRNYESKCSWFFFERLDRVSQILPKNYKLWIAKKSCWKMLMVKPWSDKLNNHGDPDFFCFIWLIPFYQLEKNRINLIIMYGNLFT